MTEPTKLRILVADDQPDVLLALRFLLKAEGFAIETADHPAAILRSVAAAPPDIVLMDLNYTRDTTSGEECLAGDRDDGVGQRRSRCRSHAARRARLCAEALGQ